MTGLFYKLPQDIAARRDLLPSDKLVYAVVLNAFNGKDVCWPGKRDIMEKTGLSGQAVCDAIDRLDKAGVLVVERRGNGKPNHYRTSQQIRPVKELDRSNLDATGGQGFRPEPVNKVDHKRKDQFKRLKYIPKKTSAKFIKPSPGEVTEYAQSIGFVLDGQHFVDHYTARGWLLGQNKMKDWQAAVRTWKNNEAKNGKSKNRPRHTDDFSEMQSAYGISIEQ